LIPCFQKKTDGKSGKNPFFPFFFAQKVFFIVDFHFLRVIVPIEDELHGTINQ